MEMLITVVAFALIGLFVWVRIFMNRSSGGYQRRFNRAPLRRPDDAPPRDDAAFPFASTLYVGDGGASASHHHHGADCSPTVNVDVGCSDGGGGGGAGGIH